MPSRRLLLPAVLLAGLLLPAGGADAARGFFLQQNLRLVDTLEDGATGGFTSWFRFRNDHTTVQGLRVWAAGLSDAEGASVWFVKPGESEAAEVGEMAWSDNGSAFYEVVIDSRNETGPEIPLGLESVLKLYHGLLQVRGSADELLLEVRVGNFSFEDIDLTQRGRRTRLRRAPEGPVPDDFAEGSVRTWRRRAGGTRTQGVALVARGLADDAEYEVWVENPAGDLVEVGGLVATIDGLGLWAVDVEEGEDLLLDVDDGTVAGTVGDLRHRRIELRRAASPDYSLVGLFR